MTVPTGFSRRVVFFAGIVGLAVSSVLVTDDVGAALITWANPTDGEWDTVHWTPP